MAVSSECLVASGQFVMDVPHYYHHHGALKRYKTLLRNDDYHRHRLVWNGRINDEIFRHSPQFHPDQHLRITIFEILDKAEITYEQIRSFCIENNLSMGGPQLLTLVHRSPSWNTAVPIYTPVVSPNGSRLFRAGEGREVFAGVMKTRHEQFVAGVGSVVSGSTFDMFNLHDGRYPDTRLVFYEIQ
jgi:hypothetical protein